MHLYWFVLFIHVLSAIGLFVGLVLEGFVSVRMGRAMDANEMGFFIRAFDRLRWIFIPSGAGILFGGLYLGSKYGGGTFWIPAALIATLAIIIIGGLIMGRGVAKLRKALADRDIAFDVLSAKARSAPMALSYGLRAGLALGIVFLMTAKPDGWVSFSALIAGCLSGLFIAYGIRGIWNRGEACVPWQRRDLPETHTIPIP